MIEAIYNHMAMPENCHLGKRVFKKHFYDNATLTATDKKAFRDDIDTIIWQYILKPATIQIPAYKDQEREYLEIAVLQGNLKNPKRYKRIAEVIHRAIPYPLVLVLASESSFAISLAHKRFSQAERGKVVAEEFLATSWIDMNSQAKVEADFLASLEIKQLQHSHLLAFYSSLVDRLIAMDCARLTGEFRLESTSKRRKARRKRLAACHELEVKIAEHRSAIKKETQFNRQVELNAKINELQKNLERETNLL